MNQFINRMIQNVMAKVSGDCIRKSKDCQGSRITVERARRLKQEVRSIRLAQSCISEL